MSDDLKNELLRINLLDDIEQELRGRIRFGKCMDALGLVFAWWRENFPDLIASIPDSDIERVRERVLCEVVSGQEASALFLSASDLLEAPLVPLDGDRALLTDFPLAARDLDRGYSPFGQRGGVEFDAGWNALAREVFAFLEHEADIRKRIGFPDSALPRIAQAKEKFGQMTIYADSVGSVWKEWRQLMEDVAERAASVCERCSAPATLRKGGWVHTYCDSCEDALQAAREQQ